MADLEQRLSDGGARLWIGRERRQQNRTDLDPLGTHMQVHLRPTVQLALNLKQRFEAGAPL